MRVLFVCTGNAHRSPLAEALLKKARPDWFVESAGLDVAIPIAAEVRRYLAEENAEQYLKKTPESMHGKMLDFYDIIVVMENRHKEYILSICPHCVSKIIVWNIEDPYFLPVDEARKIYDQIKKKVLALARSC